MKRLKIIGMVIIVFIMGITLTGCTAYESDEDRELNRKKEQCSAMSDTYNKCSYSLWEARCVCKRR